MHAVLFVLDMFRQDVHPESFMTKEIHRELLVCLDGLASQLLGAHAWGPHWLVSGAVAWLEPQLQDREPTVRSLALHICACIATATDGAVALQSLSVRVGSDDDKFSLLDAALFQMYDAAEPLMVRVAAAQARACMYQLVLTCPRC